MGQRYVVSAWIWPKAPAVRTPPFPRQSVLVLHCPPGEAPKLPNAAIAICHIAWHYGEIVFSFDFVVPSSGRVGSDHVVLSVSLPNHLSQRGQQNKAIGDVSVCGLNMLICVAACVYMYTAIVHMCTRACACGQYMLSLLLVGPGGMGNAAFIFWATGFSKS